MDKKSKIKRTRRQRTGGIAIIRRIIKINKEHATAQVKALRDNSTRRVSTKSCAAKAIHLETQVISKTQIKLGQKKTK